VPFSSMSLVHAFAFPDMPDSSAAARLEEAVAAQESVEQRARLLGFYTSLDNPSEADVDRKLEHLRILIALNPSEAFLAMPLDPSDSRHERIAAEWRKQARLHSDSPDVLVNAAMFLVHWNYEEGRDLGSRALRLQPDSWQRHLQYGRMLLQRAARCAPTAAAKELAAEALREFECGFALASDSARLLFHDALAEATLIGDDHVKAATHARTALAVADSGEWAEGRLLHVAYTVLGSLAFDQGDLPAAREWLERSLLVPESPQFCVTGPCPHLLRRLSAAGDDAAVEEYLTLWRDRFTLPTNWKLEGCGDDV
jgi:hypothetical protein